MNIIYLRLSEDNQTINAALQFMLNILSQFFISAFRRLITALINSFHNFANHISVSLFAMNFFNSLDFVFSIYENIFRFLIIDFSRFKELFS
jgi:hypothetical protein